MSDENKQENENPQSSLETKPPQTGTLSDSPPKPESNEPEEGADKLKENQHASIEAKLPQTDAKNDKPAESGKQESDKDADKLKEHPQPPMETKSPQTNTLSEKPAESEKQETGKETVKFDDAQSKTRQTNNFDPTKDTAVLSRDNPLLRRALSHQSDDSEQFQGTTTLGEKREVILLIRGMAERVVMQEGVIYKLGRFELGMAAPNEIDLTPYGAMDRGVSRVHAQLHLQDDHLYITDLSSTNGTYVSGNKIEPDSPTALRKGDELLLGRLQVQILFR